MSSNTNIGNTPVNQGYVQLIHTGETGGIDGTLRTLYDGDGTAADLLIASDKVKVSTELFIGAKTLTEFIQDTVGTMFTTGNSLTNVSVTYDDANNNIDLNATGEVTLTGSQTLTNKTLTSPVINTSVSGTAILDEDNMSSNSDSKLATQQSIKAYVDAEVSSLVSSAPTALDTLDELAAALGDDANFATTTATSLGEKLVKASNLSDLTNTTTARSNLGLGSLATANNISVSNFNDAALQTSSESFADNDTSVMTSAAIQDKIESFGYTTNTGDMTGVSITASNPLDISQSNTTSGSYSATISLVASEFGGYLADMTDLVVGATDELAVLDNGTLKRKQIDEIRLTAFDATGFSSGISFNGSTANGLLTFGNSTTADVESGLTYGGSALNLTGNLNISGYIYDSVNSGNRLDLDDDSDSGQGNQVALYGINHLNLVADNTNNGTGEIRFWNGAVSDLDSGTNTRLMTIDNSGNVTFNAGDVKLGATKKLFFDGGSNTYITESSADRVKIFVGGSELVNIIEDSTNVFRLSDNVQGTFGNADDLQIFHDGTDTKIKNDTGDFYISNDANDKDLILRSDDGSGGQTAYITLDGSAETINISKNMDFGDNVRARLGAGDDLQLGHDGNDSFISNYTGDYYINQFADDKDIILRCDDGGGGITPYITLDGSATCVNIDKDVKLAATKKLYLDGGGNTYIFEESADQITMSAGGGNYFKLSNTNLVVNDPGASFDFRVEGDTDQNLLFTDGSTDRVGIGTNSPGHKVHIDSAGDTNSCLRIDADDNRGANRYALDIVDDDTNSRGSVRVSTTSGIGMVLEADPPKLQLTNTRNGSWTTGDEIAQINFHSNDASGIGAHSVGFIKMITGTGSTSLGGEMTFGTGDYNTAATERMRIDEDGNVGIGVTSPSFSYGSLGLEIQSTGDTSLRLERDGSTAFEISARSSDVLIYNPGTARNFRFGIGGTEEFRMDTSGNFHADADVIAFSTTTASDIKFKENVKSIPYGLKEVLQMNPVEFDWIEKRDGTHDIGFIAQEMEKIVPEVIKETETLEVGGTHKTMDYAKLTSILVQAIQEQQEQINELKEQLNG